MTIQHPSPRRYLAAFVAALCAPAASAEPPPLVADGTWLDIDAGTYETSEPSRHGILAINGGKADGKQVIVHTLGKSASAVRVSGLLSEITLTGGELATKGDLAHGLHVTGTRRTVTTLHDVDIRTEGGSATGATFALDAAVGRIVGGSVHTRGKAAAGVVAEDSGQFLIEGTSVRTEGDNAAGLIARDGKSSLSARSASVETWGKESHGVHTQYSATASLETVSVTTHGEWANALNVNTGSGLFTVTRGELLTHGDHAAGVGVSDGGPVSLADSRIETMGDFALGMDNRGGSVSVGDADVVTHGRQSHGLLAQGGDHPGQFPQIDLRDSRVTTSGAVAYGVFANKGGGLRLRDSSIHTSGTNAHGVMVSGGTVRSTDSSIETSGAGAYGAIVQAGGTFRMDGGSLHSRHAAALGLHDPGIVRFTGGTSVTSGNGVFAEVDPASTGAFTVVLDDGAIAVGDIRLSDEPGVPPPDQTKFSLSIKKDAGWSGGTSVVRHVSLESGGSWTVTGDSRVGSLRNDHGVVAFATPASGSFGTLTIAGDYEGNDGLLRMRGRISDDDSPADLLHVMGNTSGSSQIAVDVLDGAGDHTQDGIPLVRVDGRSEGSFRLAGRAVAGAHEYFLHQGSLSQPGDGDWYLRSSIRDLVVDPETAPDPVETVDPGEPPAPVLRPETGTYRANQTAALAMFLSGPGGGEDDEDEGTRRSAWARFERQHTTFELRDQITTTTATNELTLGADLLRGEGAVTSHMGVMASAGQADTRGRSLLTRYSAKGRVRGAATGLYAGIRTKHGTYLRGWTQYAHFNQRVEGDALQSERYGSGALTASIEAGHRWRTTLGAASDGYLEPQAQLIATRLRGGMHAEANGTRVAPVHASGLTSRLGARAAARWNTPGGHVASPYVAANWLRRLGKMDATQLDGETFAGGVPRNSYALKLGVAILRQSGWRVWGDVETRFGARRYRRVAGTLGVRKTW
ncbi:autotransporter family porin [Luteibacter sp. W1I16]|uniref:autotransporter family protein n=1 Tax=Luteibacter sp. W1I16 TaxID=3373922 RepID=UPI003D245BD1